MKKPVIGIVTTWFERGAAYVSRAYRDVLSKDFDVRIYARGGESSGRGTTVWDTADVWWADSDSGTRINRQDFESWIDTFNIRLVIFNEQQWWPPILWARRHGVKTVAYIDYYTPETVRWFWAYDALMCNTRRHYGVFRKHPGAAYLPWGTDVRVFRPHFRFDDSQLTFFHSAGMGGVHLRKGTDLVIRAFQSVSGPTRLVIHSQVSRSFLGEVGSLLDADPRISFIEGTVTAPGLYHLGHVYIYPTRLEGIGLTILEALACGLPVIATDVAPCNEFVSPGVNGWLVPVCRKRIRSDGYYWPETECDLGLLAAQMQECVNRRAELKAWSQAARMDAERRFDWEVNAGDLTRWVAQLLDRPSQPVPKGIDRSIERCYSSEQSLGWRVQWRVNSTLAKLRWLAQLRLT
jgi:1,2-diacylglycerol 3-alpha-glucosyltransferase